MDGIEMLKTLGNTFADYPHAAQGTPQERCANMVAAIEHVVAEDYIAATLTDEPMESWRSRTDDHKAELRRGLARDVCAKALELAELDVVCGPEAELRLVESMTEVFEHGPR